MAFSGFPSDTRYTNVPDPLLGPLLEEIRDLTELKVTLRGLYLLQHKRHGPKAVWLAEFLSDTALLRGMEVGSLPGEADEVATEIRRGLRLAVRRRTFLYYGTGLDDTVFVLNDDAGRKTLAELKRNGAMPEAETGANEPPSGPQERPDIFTLYENTVGLISSDIVKERLEEAEGRYPPGWIQEAFEIAALENKRNWNYISSILARWGSEGKGNWAGGSKDDGKPGRDSPQNHRRKHIEDYQRRRGRSGSRTGAR